MRGLTPVRLSRYPRPYFGLATSGIRQTHRLADHSLTRMLVHAPAGQAVHATESVVVSIPGATETSDNLQQLSLTVQAVGGGGS